MKMWIATAVLLLTVACAGKTTGASSGSSGAGGTVGGATTRGSSSASSSGSSGSSASSSSGSSSASSSGSSGSSGSSASSSSGSSSASSTGSSGSSGASGSAMCAPCTADGDCGVGAVCIAEAVDSATGYCATACAGSGCAEPNATCSDVAQAGVKNCYPASGFCGAPTTWVDGGLPAPNTILFGRDLFTCPQPNCTLFSGGTYEIDCFVKGGGELDVFFQGTPAPGSYDAASNAHQLQWSFTRYGSYYAQQGTFDVGVADGGALTLSFENVTMDAPFANPPAPNVVMSGNLLCP